MAKFKEGDKVTLRDMGITGKVRRVRTGSEHGGDLYTVYTDDPKAMPNGMFVAREQENCRRVIQWVKIAPAFTALWTQ